MFQGKRLTAALLDRLTHHCEKLEMNRESDRFGESPKGKQSPPVEKSSWSKSEFEDPNPTLWVIFKRCPGSDLARLGLGWRGQQSERGPARNRIGL